MISFLRSLYILLYFYFIIFNKCDANIDYKGHTYKPGVELELLLCVITELFPLTSLLWNLIFPINTNIDCIVQSIFFALKIITVSLLLILKVPDIIIMKYLFCFILKWSILDCYNK